MSGCCQSAVAACHFGPEKAREQLDAYRSGGPDRLTQIALAMLREQPITDAGLVDVGGGIGVLGRELLGDRITAVTIVEESGAYLSVARAQAEGDGTFASWRFVQGDFVDVAPGVGRADLVTLHRVVCCYPDYATLLSAVSATDARWALLSYPRDRWYVRAALWAEDCANRLRGDPFRSRVHPEEGISRTMREGGFRRVSETETWFWRVEVHARS